jgi:glutamate formiminotransferase
MGVVACTLQVSEGRDRSVVESIVAAIRAVEGTRLLDRIEDEDQNRSVITFAAAPRTIAEAAMSAAREALRRIDLERHQGGHPRIGALDELALFPLAGVTLEDCVRLAREIGERLGTELELPVYFADEAATRPELRRAAALRHIGFEGLRASEGGEGWIEPDAGPRERLHPRGGATVVVARPALCLLEVELATEEMALARRIVDRLRREPLTAGMRAAATALGPEDHAAVNIEIRDPLRVGIETLVQHIGELAAENGSSVRAVRIESLVQEAALPSDALHRLPLVDFRPERQVFERLLAAHA